MLEFESHFPHFIVKRTSMPIVYKVYFLKKENLAYLKQNTKLQLLGIYMTSGKLNQVDTSVDGAALVLQSPALSLILVLYDGLFQSM